jgi:ribosomal-protein-alanine N-acetyltransferase
MTPFNRPRRTYALDDPPPKLHPHIEVGFRWLSGGDLGAIAAIEAASFPHPMGAGELDLLRMSQGVSGLIAEYNGLVAGFVFYGFNRGWLELHDLAVHPELRRHGVGRQMMDWLKQKVERNGRRQMTATLRETNLLGLAYLKACGWRAPRKGAVVRGFYGGEDAIIMVYRAVADEDCVGW